MIEFKRLKGNFKQSNMLDKALVEYMSGRRKMVMEELEMYMSSKLTKFNFQKMRNKGQEKNVTEIDYYN